MPFLTGSLLQLGKWKGYLLKGMVVSMPFLTGSLLQPWVLFNLSTIKGKVSMPFLTGSLLQLEGYHTSTGESFLFLCPF